MDEIKDLISDYIAKSTNYAVLINGKWGSGKTYYFKNVLVDIIEKQKIRNGNPKSFKVIYLPLYGIKSIDNIYTQILSELYPILNRKNVKLAISTTKIFARGLLAISGFRNIDDYIEDGKEATKEILIEPYELFFCFDDLERCHPDLRMKELLGFINYLVDDLGCKVCIITNEGKIADIEYQIIKEKTIGFTYEFNPIFNNSVYSICQQKYKHTYKKFGTFISNHEELVLTNLKHSDSNLRTVIFALDKLKDVFYYLEENLSDRENVFSKAVYNNLDKVIILVLALAIEFHNGGITNKNKNELRLNLKNDISLINPEYRTESNMSVLITISDKYFKPFGYTYLYFNSLLDFICAGKKIDLISFKMDIKSNYFPLGDFESDAIQVYERVKMNELYLPNVIYKQETRKLIAFAKNGDYPLGYYLTLFYLIFRHDNLLKLDKDKIEKSLKLGIRKAAIRIGFDTHIKSLKASLDSALEDHKYHKRLADYCIEQNNKQLEKEEVEYSRQLLITFYNNSISFIEEIRNSSSKSRLFKIFRNASAWKFYTTLLKLNNEQLIDLKQALNARYLNASFGAKQEIHFFKKLKTYIQRPKRRAIKSTENECLNILVQVIDKILRTVDVREK